MKKRRARRAVTPIERVRRTPNPVTPAQAERVRIMREKGIDLTTIALSLQDDGIMISRQAVSDIVTRGRWRDVKRTKRSRADAVIAEFCDLTHTTLREAWPDLVHDGEDESDPSVIDRINRARGVSAAVAAGA